MFHLVAFCLKLRYQKTLFAERWLPAGWFYRCNSCALYLSNATLTIEGESEF
ncbi:hypothetical protein MNBD_GAMMA16-1669 [hydrothermal vent metagenome]|uniref:Uncharacterized protein n=1 Tax=hydrothermal vent metagenome TaxID=652676 RepID=A0A3B0ZXS9_9ZZZZ